MRNLIIICLLNSMFACNQGNDDALFEKLDSSKTGITFSNDLQNSDELNIIEYLYFYNGGGVAVGDINNDGLEDLYFSGNQVPDALYLNLGNLRFKNITNSSGIDHKGWSNGVVMADINADGYLDIYVTQVGNYKSLSGSNKMYLNNGDNTFTEISGDVGLYFSGFSTHASFFDYDRDGDLDLYVLNHAVHTTRSYQPASTRNEFDSLAGDRLYENLLNEGRLEFKDVSQKTGIYSSAQGFGLGLVTADINQDGWPDVYVGNDFHEDDYLYINHGDGTFKSLKDQYIGHTSRFTMGVDVADIDGDDLFDVFSLDMLPRDQEILMKSGGEDHNKVAEAKLEFGYGYQYARNAFQLNQANKHFSEIALLTETYATDWSWSVLLQDYDNDGRTDIFISNGIYKRPNDLDYINFLSNFNFGTYDEPKQNEVERELIKGMPTLKIPNYMYRNKGDLNFEEVGSAWGLGEPSYSNGSVYSDLDNDGDLDLVINNVNTKVSVYENRASRKTGNHFIQFKLQGDSLNQNAIGAKIKIWFGDQSAIKEVATSRGFQSSQSSRLHFGLGQSSAVDSLLIQWPEGELQKISGLQADSLYTVSKKETYSDKSFLDLPAVLPITFLEFEHKENGYKDYNYDALVPEKLSTEGPAAVAADFNRDGYEDLFIGGARGGKSMLFLGSKDGFDESSTWPSEENAQYEDVDAAPFDFDNDGDLDLYVVRGGNDYPYVSEFYQDQLYLNDGNAQFTKSQISLPSVNGSCVAAADYNNDGYIDLFVGSRSVPGGYGLSPVSFLMENIDGKSFAVVKEWQVGMVTDAAWMNYDQDSFDDLFITGDWMPVTVLKNLNGSDFENSTGELGLGRTHGLWNSIEISDINCDGKQDLIVGNMGLNSKLKATADEPITLYLDDYDENGQPDPIIFYNKNGETIPFATRDELTEQLPHLKKEFLSYQKFSQVRSISDLVKKKPQEVETIKRLYELRSSVFVWEKDGYVQKPLPTFAQLSPVNATLVFDDPHSEAGAKRMLYAGNFFGSVTSVGRYDACAGGLLTVNCDGELEFDRFLPLEFDREYRKIIELKNDKFVLVPNGGRPILLEKNKLLNFSPPDGLITLKN